MDDEIRAGVEKMLRNPDQKVSGTPYTVRDCLNMPEEQWRAICDADNEGRGDFWLIAIGIGVIAGLVDFVLQS
jgi:hypothetical protein